MEHIKFNSELSISDLVAIAKDIIGPKGKLEEQAGDKPLGKIIGVSHGHFSEKQTLCFLDKPPTPEVVKRVSGSLVIANKDIALALGSSWMIIVDDPRALFIDLLNRLLVAPGFSCFTSVVDVIPAIHFEAEVHPQAVIEERVYIGAGTRISAGCVIKQGTYIGNDVTIRENTVIGCDGIALYKSHDDRVLRFPHLGGVIIEDEVEIGSSCVLPGGVMLSSRIGRDTVIGNLSNLGHGIKIGGNVWMSAGCLIGGNTTIGEKSTFGLGVKVRDNLSIGDNCSIGMGAVVVRDVPDGASMFGNPAKKMFKISAGPER